MWLCRCGREIKGEFYVCECGRMWLWKLKSGKYVYAGDLNASK